MGAAGVQSARAITVRHKPCSYKTGPFWPPDIDGERFTLRLCGVHPYYSPHVTWTRMTSLMHVSCTCILQNIHILAIIPHFSFTLWPNKTRQSETKDGLWCLTMFLISMQSLAHIGETVCPVWRVMLVVVNILHFHKFWLVKGYLNNAKHHVHTL